MPRPEYHTSAASRDIRCARRGRGRRRRPGRRRPQRLNDPVLTSFSTDLHSDILALEALLTESSDSLRSLSFVGGDTPTLPLLIQSLPSLTSLTIFSERWTLFGPAGHDDRAYYEILQKLPHLEVLRLGYAGYTLAIFAFVHVHSKKLERLELRVVFENAARTSPIEIVLRGTHVVALKELTLGRGFRDADSERWERLEQAAKARGKILSVSD